MADFYRKQFERAKSLRVVPRLVHKSCGAGMRVNPLDPNGPLVAWVQVPGKTLNLGRNKSKRENRRADIKARKQRRKAA